MQIVHQKCTENAFLSFASAVTFQLHCKGIFGYIFDVEFSLSLSLSLSPLMYDDLRLQLKCKSVILHTWFDRSSNRLGLVNAAKPILLLDIKSGFLAPLLLFILYSVFFSLSLSLSLSLLSQEYWKEGKERKAHIQKIC